MKVIIDAMSGDNAPQEILKGAFLAKKQFSADILLVGDEPRLKKCAEEMNISLEGMELVHASDTITMEDPPTAVRDKTDSSMRVGFRLLREGKGDAFVGAGNTGAMHVGSTLFVRRIPGVRRSAIGTILPLTKPLLLVDSGANTAVTEDFLLQFAQMGSVYMKKMFGIESPRVGLLNNGAKESKATELYTNAYQKLLAEKSINFIGNVEGKEIPFGKCDILVCDGFTGNIALKTLEGMGLFVMKKIKHMFLSSLRAKMAYPLLRGKIKALRQEFNTSEYGGAPFLGIAAPVIKAHGSSDAEAIKNAVRQAITYHETGTIAELTALFTANKPDTPAPAEG